MGLRCRQRNLPSPVHGLTIAACLIAHLALSIGFPMARPRQDRAGESAGKSTERFPCEHHRCGCNSAEQCWRSCCCHSLDERLAWAERQGVEPPLYVRQLLALRGTSSQSAEHDMSGDACEHGCCAAELASDSDSDGGGCCKPTNHAAPPDDRDHVQPSGDWVLGFQALKCQGLSLTWVSTGVVLPTPMAGKLERDQSVAPFFPTLPTRLASRTLAPETPPPRRSAI